MLSDKLKVETDSFITNVTAAKFTANATLQNYGEKDVDKTTTSETYLSNSTWGRKVLPVAVKEKS